MRITLFLLMSIFFSPQVLAQDTVAIDALRAAYLAKEKGNWDEALRLARPAGDVGLDLIEWDRLRAGKGEFAAAQEFLIRRPDWPGLPYLRKRSEVTIKPDALAEDVIAFFDGQAPRTAQGRCGSPRLWPKKARPLPLFLRYDGVGSVSTWMRILSRSLEKPLVRI
jgi:soluble lytic murein transglycosylase